VETLHRLVCSHYFALPHALPSLVHFIENLRRFLLPRHPPKRQDQEAPGSYQECGAPTCAVADSRGSSCAEAKEHTQAKRVGLVAPKQRSTRRQSVSV
jgi:hypothetical protein